MTVNLVKLTAYCTEMTNFRYNESVPKPNYESDKNLFSKNSAYSN